MCDSFRRRGFQCLLVFGRGCVKQRVKESPIEYGLPATDEEVLC